MNNPSGLDGWYSFWFWVACGHGTFPSWPVYIRRGRGDDGHRNKVDSSARPWLCWLREGWMVGLPDDDRSENCDDSEDVFGVKVW